MRPIAAVKGSLSRALKVSCRLNAERSLSSFAALQVKEQLEGVAEQPVWSQAAAAHDFDLPAFSAYPGPYITSVGEYLMMLPSLLESVLVDGAEAPDDECHVDGEWLDKVPRRVITSLSAQQPGIIHNIGSVYCGPPCNQLQHRSKGSLLCCRCATVDLECQLSAAQHA